MRCEGAVVDTLNIVATDCRTLVTHLCDEIVEETTFTHECIVECVEERRRWRSEVHRSVVVEQSRRHQLADESVWGGDAGAAVESFKVRSWR